MSEQNTVERRFDGLLFASRWLMVPIGWLVLRSGKC